MGGDKMSHSPYLDSCNMIEKSFFSDKAPIYNKVWNLIWLYFCSLAASASRTLASSSSRSSGLSLSNALQALLKDNPELLDELEAKVREALAAKDQK